MSVADFMMDADVRFETSVFYSSSGLSQVPSALQWTTWYCDSISLNAGYFQMASVQNNEPRVCPLSPARAVSWGQLWLNMYFWAIIYIFRKSVGNMDCALETSRKMEALEFDSHTIWHFFSQLHPLLGPLTGALWTSEQFPLEQLCWFSTETRT